jgi:hypothetical protein
MADAPASLAASDLATSSLHQRLANEAIEAAGGLPADLPL